MSPYFDRTYFDPAYFDTDAEAQPETPTSNAGGHKAQRRLQRQQPTAAPDPAIAAEDDYLMALS